MRDFLRLLSEDLRSGGGDREAREAALAGEGAGGRREEEEDGEAWQNEVNPESFLHNGDTLEVW